MKKPTNSDELKDVLENIDTLLTNKQAPAIHVMCLLNSLFEDSVARQNFDSGNVALAKGIWEKLTRAGITLKEPPILTKHA
jgi:hypothetical protein